MLLRNYVEKQNILASDKVHIRQKLAAYSIVGNKPKQELNLSEHQPNTMVTSIEEGDAAGMEYEFDDDDEDLNPFNEAEDFLLKDIAEYNNDDDNVVHELQFDV